MHSWFETLVQEHDYIEERAAIQLDNGWVMNAPGQTVERMAANRLAALRVALREVMR